MIQFPWFKICLDLSSRYCLSYTRCFFVQWVVSGWIYVLSSPQRIETKTKLRKETNWIYVRLVEKAPLKILHQLKYLLSGTFLFPKKCLFMIHMSNIHSLLSRKTSCFSNFFFYTFTIHLPQPTMTTVIYSNACKRDWRFSGKNFTHQDCCELRWSF